MEKVLKTGTTIIGLKYKDGIVLGADRRMTMGHMIANSGVEKVVKLTDYLVTAFAGTVSDIQMLIDVLKSNFSYFEKDRSRKITTQEAASFMSNQMRSHIRGAAIGPVGFILGGFDKVPGLYEIYSDGTLTEYNTYIADGSGSVFAIGVLESEYKENMSKDEAISLVKKALKIAMKKDSASGDGYFVYNVDSSGSKVVLDEKI